jgi:hypothetical protein
MTRFTYRLNVELGIYPIVFVPILLSKIVIKIFCKTILFYQNFLDINDPVHDYQNVLQILSLTLIKYIRFRKKYFILTSILLRESYSHWVCLKNSEHYHIWYSSKLEFLLREVVSLCNPFI